jgi:hypothetical protein
MTTSRTPIARPSLSLADDPHRGRFGDWLTHRSSSSFLTAAGLLAATGALLVTEDLTGITLFPVALTTLALGMIALAAGLVGLTALRRRHRLRGGRAAMASSGIAAASGMVLVVLVLVGIATGGLTGDAPAIVDRLAAITMLLLPVSLFLALLLTGVGTWRSGIPSRAIGMAVAAAAAPFLLPVTFAITGTWPGDLVGLALFVIWAAIFAGIGTVLRRG